MEVIAAPGRQFKTVSFWLDVALFAVGPITELLHQLSTGDSPLVSARIVGAVVSVVAALSLIARFVKQQIEMTAVQKMEAIKSTVDQPVPAGQRDVVADVKVVPPPGNVPSSVAIKEWVNDRVSERLAPFEQRFASLETLVLSSTAGKVAAPGVPSVPAT